MRGLIPLSFAFYTVSMSFLKDVPWRRGPWSRISYAFKELTCVRPDTQFHWPEKPHRASYHMLDHSEFSSAPETIARLLYVCLAHFSPCANPLRWETHMCIGMFTHLHLLWQNRPHIV